MNHFNCLSYGVIACVVVAIIGWYCGKNEK